jgi:hypothetical protein
MATYLEVPTAPGQPFTERLQISGVFYTLRFAWNTRANYWVLEFWDDSNIQPVIAGIPLVTGCDLLEQFIYLPLGAHAMLIVMTVGPAKSPDSVPDFYNLGIDGHLFLVTP